MPSLPDSSGPFARARLFKLEASRWLFAWWVGLHLILAFAVFMANPPPAAALVLLIALAWHFRRLDRSRGELLIAGPRGRFALPAAGRFDLALAGSPRVAGFWIELSFSDRPGSHFLILRDQLTEPDWRRLSLILRERL
jgi:Membrane-bound toxin component of toxin-antitoxin system